VIKVPSLSRLQLAGRVNQLLSAYAETIGEDVPLPIPIVEIAESHLALGLECVDLHTILGVPKRANSPGILGRMLFNEQKIQIDHSLDPDQNPRQLGRYRYSIGHEIGHWVLHRSIVFRNLRKNQKPIIVCHEIGETTTPPPVEVQAEAFSSHLLMPTQRVLNAWGDRPPIAFSVHSHGSKELSRLWVDRKAEPIMACSMYRAECNRWFDEFSAPLTKLFGVSNQAMRARLQALGLLRRARRFTGLGQLPPPQKGELEGILRNS